MDEALGLGQGSVPLAAICCDHRVHTRMVLGRWVGHSERRACFALIACSLSIEVNGPDIPAEVRVSSPMLRCIYSRKCKLKLEFGMAAWQNGQSQVQRVAFSPCVLT